MFNLCIPNTNKQTYEEYCYKLINKLTVKQFALDQTRVWIAPGFCLILCIFHAHKAKCRGSCFSHIFRPRFEHTRGQGHNAIEKRREKITSV